MPPKGKKKGQSLPGETSDDDMPISNNKKGQQNNNNNNKKGKGNKFSDDEDNIPQPVKKGGKNQPPSKGGKFQDLSDEEDIPQPVKKGGKNQPQQNNNNKKNNKFADSDEELEDKPQQPVSKGGKQPASKGGKSPKVESDEEIEDIPQPVKKGGKNQQPAKGGKGNKKDESEDEEMEDIPQPVKKGGKNQQPAKGGKGNKKVESEDEIEDEVPLPVKKGGKNQQNKKGGKSFESDEEEDIPQPVKKGGKNQQPAKGGKGNKKVESEDEEEDIPQPVKKGGKNQQPAKGGKGNKKVESEDEEEEEEEEEVIPQPVKKGGKNQQPAKGGKGNKKVESEDEEEEEEVIPQPVKKGGKNQQPTKGKGNKKVESEDEEEEEVIPQPVKKGGKNQQPTKGKGNKKVESEDEEEEDIPQPVKKGGKNQQAGKGKAKFEEPEEEEEEVEEEPKPVSKKDKKKSQPKTKKVESEEEEEEEEEEEVEEPVSNKDKKKSSSSKSKDEELSKSLSDLSIEESKKKDKKRSSSKKDKKSSKSKKVVEEEEEEEEVVEEVEEKSLTLAERKALKEAKKKQKIEKKLEKKKKSRYQEEDDFESLKEKNKQEIDYDNVDIEDVPGIEPPNHVHLKSGQDLRSKIGNDIKFDNLTLQVPGKTLLENASLTLAYGQKYGFVGRNGIGKSTLVKKIATRDEIVIAPHLRVLYVEQEVEGTEETPLEVVLNADQERAWLIKEEKVLVQLEKDDPNWQFNPREKRNYNLRDIYDRLREIDSDRAIIRAEAILMGLGFTKEEVCVKKVREYSGGWRMRIALARALFCKPEILLLDEPSNHLDLHACVWLEKYLQGWDRTLVVVSHEASFLNEVVDNIIHIHDKKLSQYKGNWDAFQKQRAVNIRTQESAKVKQDVKVKKLKEFVAKNKNNKNAATASKKNKELKEIKTIRVEREDASLIVDFPEPEHLVPPLLRFDDVYFGYEGQKEMFKKLFCGVDMDSKIALVGMNGVGKSTLMKLMSGELHETKGYIERSRKCRIARFSQHFVEQLDTDVSPIEYFQNKFNNPPVQQIRNHLGRFGITQTLPTHQISTLSGGQKSRVILAELAWAQPHILLLDEPTNHLDIDAIEALAEGINEYKGGVVLISHNQHLINLIADKIWVVKKDGTVSLYPGDFMDYKEEISREIDQMIVRS